MLTPSSQIGWLTWAGFASVFVAVFIVVVAVTQVDRPAAAPQTGDYELGFAAIAHPTFSTGIVATCSIFVSYAGTSAFLPVISEMREPRDFRKSLYLCMAIVIASYNSFSLVVYRYCGGWVAVPSLGSAGETVKIAAYGVGFIGLLVSGCLYLHVGAKYSLYAFCATRSTCSQTRGSIGEYGLDAPAGSERLRSFWRKRFRFSIICYL